MPRHHIEPCPSTKGAGSCHGGGASRKWCPFKLQMLWSNLFLITSLTLFGPWRAASICPTKGRNLSPSEDSLQPDEIDFLNEICKAYYQPPWCSASDYGKIAEKLSLEDIRMADWSENVAPFWPAVIKSFLTEQGLTSLYQSGWKPIKGALAMPLMVEGYRKNLIKLAIITCRKPE